MGDFLVLRNLTTDEKTIDLVEQNTGERIDPECLSAFDELPPSPCSPAAISKGYLQLRIRAACARSWRDLKPLPSKTSLDPGVVIAGPARCRA